MLTTRRALVSGMATMAVAACQTKKPDGGEPAPSSGAVQESAAAVSLLSAYCGVYHLADDHFLGVQSFLNDSGDELLLFADYRTSVVRPLRQTAAGDFTMGPSFDATSPVELTVSFQRGARGEVETLVLRSADGTEASARKASLAHRGCAARTTIANCSNRHGPMIRPPTFMLCACTFGICVKRWRSTPISQNKSSPNPASATDLCRPTRTRRPTSASARSDRDGG